MEQVRLKNEEIGTVCLSLANLFHAGIGAGDAFALLAEDETAPVVRALFSTMARGADEGRTLAELFQESGCFPAYVHGLLNVGEKVGKTEETLYALALYYEGRVRMDQRLRAALLYPSVLLLVLLAVVIVLLVWVLPVFNDVYAQLGSRLTGVAGGLLAVGTILRKGMPVLCVLLGAVVLFTALIATRPIFRERILSAWNKKQGDRGISRSINEARFAQALSMGLTSGMTPQEAVGLAASLGEDAPVFQTRCEACLKALGQGETLPEALRVSSILPRAECRLLEAGIRSGSGETVMEQIAQRLLEKSQLELEEAVGKVEPTLVVVMSVIVGVILLSVMLPLVHIMTAIG